MDMMSVKKVELEEPNEERTMEKKQTMEVEEESKEGSQEEDDLNKGTPESAEHG